MAFFKFRTATEGSGAARPAESIEAMRRRARHRLIGATVLVLAGVVGFPLLFDTQPRPIAVDIPIDIPDRNKAKPLPIPARPATSEPVATGKVSPPPVPAAAPAPAFATPSAAMSAIPAPAAKTEAVAKAEPAPAKPEPKPESKPAPKAAAADDGSKAQALLEGKPVKQAAAADGRFVVQIGAFADNAKAREARLRVEHAGLKTYTQVAETKDGRRIRVRVGPFTTRAEADKAAQKIKGLDLPANILTLS
jgi:DedD protein